MNHPSFQFYPGDWLRDDVAGLSLAAQGLWLRLLIVMHDSPRRGFLTSGQGPMPAGVAARKCGTDLATYESLLKELEDAGVASRTSDNILFNRRMARDETARLREREKKRRQRCKDVEPTPPIQVMSPFCPSNVPPDVPALSPHSSSSSSSSTSKRNTNTPPLPPCGGNETLQAVLREWVEYKAERNQRYKPKGLAVLERRMLDWGPERSRNAVDFSVSNGYSGLFEPNSQSGAKSDFPAKSAYVFVPREQLATGE